MQYKNQKYYVEGTLLILIVSVACAFGLFCSTYMSRADAGHPPEQQAAAVEKHDW